MHAKSMLQITFTVGVGMDKDGNAIGASDAATAIQHCGEAVEECFGAFTMVKGFGRWEGIIEPVVVFTVCTEDNQLEPRERAMTLARILAGIARQACVAVAVQPVDFNLVFAEDK